MSKGTRLARRKGQGALRLFLEKVGERGVAYTAPHYQGCAVTVVFFQYWRKHEATYLGLYK